MAILFIAFGYLCWYPLMGHWENLLSGVMDLMVTPFLLHYFAAGLN
jgi:hypothetical protein